MSDLAQHFCWYHINASGQHIGASDWTGSRWAYDQVVAALAQDGELGVQVDTANGSWL